MATKPIVIENRVGATGLIAAGTVAHAVPDGHTLLGMPGTITIAPSVLSDVTLDVRRDLQPISIFATSPNVLVVAPGFPARTLQEFLTTVRSKPRDEFAYATSGRGTTVHLMAGMIERSANIKMRMIPFRSSNDSIQSVIAGELPMVFSSVNSALPFIQSEAVRVLGVATERRTPILPDVPTFDEVGLADIKSDTWFGLAGPAGIPRPVLDQIAGLCAAVLTEPLLFGPDAARDLIDRELTAFSELTKVMGIHRDQQ